MNDVYYQEREAEIYDLEYQWKTDDVDFWQTLTQEYVGTDDAALELACGTGRVLFPVAGGGVRVVGVDHSPWMLAIAKRKWERLMPDAQERVGLLEADMRTLQLEQKFKLIYLPFNTLLILRTVPDQLAVFECVRQHLAPGGVFAFDIFVPDMTRLVAPAGPPMWRREVDQTLGAKGIRLERDIVSKIDPLQQRNFITWRTKEYQDNLLVREWLSDLEMTYIFPRELEHLVARAGFELVHYWGDYDRRDFWSMKEPWKQIAVVRPQ